jgi:hypothetical protein
MFPERWRVSLRPMVLGPAEMGVAQALLAAST